MPSFSDAVNLLYVNATGLIFDFAPHADALQSMNDAKVLSDFLARALARHFAATNPEWQEIAEAPTLDLEVVGQKEALSFNVDRVIDEAVRLFKLPRPAAPPPASQA